MAQVVSVNVNKNREFRKLPRPEGRLIADFGLEGDRHAGRPMRQVSLLHVEKLRELAVNGIPVPPGALGENLTLEGVDVMALARGARLRLGDEAELEITGDRPACKEMLEVHRDALKFMVGHSGRMARVVRGGLVRPGDRVVVLQDASQRETTPALAAS